MTNHKWPSSPAGILMFVIAALAICDWCRGDGVTEADEPTTHQTPETPATKYDGRTLAEVQELAKTLVLTSPAASEAVPALIAVCEDETVPERTRAQAAYLLGRIGSPARSAVPVLARLLTPPVAKADSSARWAAKALAQFGAEAASAAPPLIVLATSDRDSSARLTAVEALGRIGGAHSDAVPTLIELASRSGTTFGSDQLSGAAIDSLAAAGPAASPAVPLLIRLTRDESGNLRKRAAVALGAIGSSASVAAEALADLVLFDDLVEVRDAAATSLSMIGDTGEAALRQLLSDEEAAVRSRAATALGRLDMLSVQTRESLIQALHDVNLSVRLDAVATLKTADEPVQTLLPVLLTALVEDDRQNRIRAYRLLLDLRSSADVILPELRKLADDKRPYVRQVVEKLITELSQEPDDA